MLRKEEDSDPFATDTEDEELYAGGDDITGGAGDDDTSNNNNNNTGGGGRRRNEGGMEDGAGDGATDADRARAEREAFRPMYDTARRWPEGEALEREQAEKEKAEQALYSGPVRGGGDGGDRFVGDDDGVGDDGEPARSSEGTSWARDGRSTPPLGWSTIGKPGFQYERDSSRGETDGDVEKGVLVPPVTVDFTRIGTPIYSFDRRAGTLCPLTRIADALVARLRRVERSLDKGADPFGIEPAVDDLEAEIRKAEPALGRTAKGRVHFIKLKGFVVEMRKLLRAFVENPDLEDREGETATRLISEALMRAEKMRAVTSGLSGKGHIEASRSYKYFDDTAYLY